MMSLNTGMQVAAEESRSYFLSRSSRGASNHHDGSFCVSIPYRKDALYIPVQVLVQVHIFFITSSSQDCLTYLHTFPSRRSRMPRSLSSLKHCNIRSAPRNYCIHPPFPDYLTHAFLYHTQFPLPVVYRPPLSTRTHRSNRSRSSRSLFNHSLVRRSIHSLIRIHPLVHALAPLELKPILFFITFIVLSTRSPTCIRTL